MTVSDSKTRCRTPKFTPPGPPRHILWRARLAQTLARGLSGRLVLLRAPAGYGKSSLLASVAREWGRIGSSLERGVVAWYQLDRADDDAAVFLDGMVESVRREVPGFGNVTRSALRGTADARGRLPSLISLFQEEAREIDGGITLVLDDYHHLADASILQAIEEMTQDAGSPVRLAIATESDPRIYRSGLRSRGNLVEIQAEDLCFTPEETREVVLQLAGSSGAAARSVVHETRGWPAAVALASWLVARDRGAIPAGGLAPTEHGYGRLVGELLAGLPDSRRRQLLRVSLLRDLDGDSCRDAAGIDEGDEFLAWLENEGLPIQRVEGYHLPLMLEPLFRSALERELSRVLPTGELQAARRRVANYHLERGEWENAIRGFLQAEAPEEAARAVEKGIEAELEMGHLDTVLRWVRSIPNPVRKAHPGLGVHEARPLLARGQLDEARALLVASRPELEAAGDLKGLTQQLSGWISLRLLEGRHSDAQHLGDAALDQIPGEDSPERAEVLWQLSRAREYLGQLPSAFYLAAESLLMAEKIGRRPLAVRALQQLGHLAQLRGDLSAAIALYGRAIQRGVRLERELLLLSSLGGDVASIFLERGQPVEAVAIAETALRASQKLRDEAGQLKALVSLARAHAWKGDERASRTSLEAASSLLSGLPIGSIDSVRALQTMAALAWRRGSRGEAERRIVQALAAAEAASHEPLINQCRLMLLMVSVHGPSGILAPFRVRPLLDKFRQSDSRQWLSAGLRIMARGYLMGGFHRAARRNLEQSLELAADQGYQGLPLGIPSSDSGLLDMAIRGGIFPERAGALLGVGTAKARGLISDLSRHADLEVKSRAQQAATALDAVAEGSPIPRLHWPQLFARDGASPAVALRTLGGLYAFVDSDQVDWPSADARNLAACLLVSRGQRLSRDWLLSAIWPGEEPSSSNVRLQVALYQVREALGPGYPPVDPTLDEEGIYLWTGTGIAVDSDLFLQRTDEAMRVLGELPQLPQGAIQEEVVAILESALELYQGEFLAGFDFEWCSTSRQFLRQRALWATRLLMGHHMAKGQWQMAVKSGIVSLNCDPLQEDVVRDMMLCHFRLGDRDALLSQYREIKRQLAKERGEWPSEETRQLRIKLLGK